MALCAVAHSSYQLQHEWYTLRDLQINEENIEMCNPPIYDSTVQLLQAPHIAFIIVNIQFKVLPGSSTVRASMNFPVTSVSINDRKQLYPTVLMKSRDNFESDDYFFTTGFICMDKDKLIVQAHLFEPGFDYRISAQLFYRTK
jgi:hypothetical protein